MPWKSSTQVPEARNAAATPTAGSASRRPSTAINGTLGTDHGEGTVAFLAGGAIRGGRVIADWPGLKATDLHDGRDLKPTTDLRAVLKGLLKDHLRVDETALAAKVFPDSGAVEPMAGLLA